MIRALRRIYHPEIYQGPRRAARYFEGWYFKVVGPDRAFAVIPGISLARDDAHAFIQFIDGRSGTSSYHRYDRSTFVPARSVFDIVVGSSRFSLEGMHVRLPELTMDLSFSAAVRWQGSMLQPGTMGWYSFVPFMECKHGILVMDAVADGVVNGDAFRGRLYLEKDYGRSFPNAWIWLQSNTFEDARVSVTLSLANVPFVGGAFAGFLAGISVCDELHKFTTYLGAKVAELEVSDRSVRIVLSRGESRLSILARRERGAELVSPRDGVMDGRIVESLASTIDVELTDRGRIVYSGRGSDAGLEVVNPDRLLPTHRR